MSAAFFKVQQHIIAGQHVRQYPGATRHSEEDVQYLVLKQYTPLDNLVPQDGDVTILATHAVSFPKELYEPLFDDLLKYAKQHSFRIRGIWAPDASNQGASGIRNEETMGDDPSYSDLSRDLLHMVNVFRDQMPQPIVGIGHSMGGTAMLGLSLLHPRLLITEVLFDPVIGPSISNAGAALIYMNSVRSDLWASREAAEKVFLKANGFKRWDPRTKRLWLQYGLRDTPTLLYPVPGQVTLATTQAQEAWSYGRSTFDPLPADGGFNTPHARIKYPDLCENVLATHPFYRSETSQIWHDLPRVRPGVLYIFPAKGPMTSEQSMANKMRLTGIGSGGSGGEKEGRVAKVVIEGGHLLGFEDVETCAKASADWIGQELKAWSERRQTEKETRDDKSIDYRALSDEWKKQAKVFFDRARSRATQSRL